MLITFINLFSPGMLCVEVYVDNVRIIGEIELILFTMFNFIIITVQYVLFLKIVILHYIYSSICLFTFCLMN